MPRVSTDPGSPCYGAVVSPGVGDTDTRSRLDAHRSRLGPTMLTGLTVTPTADSVTGW